MKTVGYVRVSSKEQNLDRQVEEMKKIGIEEKYIYEDKQSGKDFERLGYKYMIRALECGDTLVIKSLDRLGRNQNGIKKEWQYFKDNGINVRVLDMPALNIDYSNEQHSGIFKMITNIVFELLSWTAENERDTIRQRQSEGIAVAKAKGKKFGRPKVEIEQGFNEVYEKWQNEEITAVKAMGILNMKRNTFYRRVQEFESYIA